MSFNVVALHKRQDLLDSCVALLNSEWSRSQAARLHSLEKSNDGLPYSLVMIETHNSKEEQVAGYCRLAKVVNQPKAAFIESVVVPTDRRGQGLGRQLMDLAEEHARCHGYTQVYLTTKDKQGFYEHIGYKYCKPVNTLNAQVLETCNCQFLTNTIVCENEPSANNSTSTCRSPDEQAMRTDQCCSETNQENVTVALESCCSIDASEKSGGCDPAPPPTNQETTSASSESCCSTEASEKSCQPGGCDPAPPTPPSVPPPPPPPLPPTKVPEITVYWMMKDL